MAARKTQRIPEAQRGTKKVQLRVAPEIASAIDARGKSAYVSRLVRRDLTEDEEREAYAADQRHDAMRERDD